jgi:hypothetical protein
VDYNNDFINDNFQADGDSDNDGILNYLDINFPGRTDTNADGKDDRFDMDLDGIVNMLDLDSDNDGITDVMEAGGVDVNGDGKIDNYSDTDGDGFSQNVDANNTGARISGTGLGLNDLDNDGKGCAVDLDSDNDGIPDVVEALGVDGNFDGRQDGFVDANTDGLNDNFINATALIRTGIDINSDGRADSYPYKNFDNDKRANPYDIDADMDGIVDVFEAGFTDSNNDGFIDGAISADGWNTARHGVALNLRNSDTRGNADYLDIDADDDGIPDNVEGQTTLGYILPSYLDNDSDGLDNSYDNTGSFGGRGVFLSDKDMDAIPDYRDLDTDADGQLDIIEGNDFNSNGSGLDDNTTLTLADTDGDGLDNRFDSLNSVTNIRGTSFKMGNGGSYAGDATPGTRSPVQQTLLAQSDRDWRSVGYVLNVQFLNFKGNAQKDIVTLNWDIITSEMIDRFEIERSTDNIRFDKISEINGSFALNVIKHFILNDDISTVSRTFIYYKLKVITIAGESKYSDVVVIKKAMGQLPPTVYPNPATEQVMVRCYAEKDEEISIQLFDKIGRMVLSESFNAKKGMNEFVIENLSQFAAGVYSLHFKQAGKSFTIKLIIQKK